jgi:hypothetical protein
MNAKREALAAFARPWRSGAIGRGVIVRCRGDREGERRGGRQDGGEDERSSRTVKPFALVERRLPAKSCFARAPPGPGEVAGDLTVTADPHAHM